MRFRFILYKDAIIKQTVITPNKIGGKINYNLIAKFPKFMYDDVRNIAEKYQGVHPDMDVIIYKYISLKQDSVFKNI